MAHASRLGQKTEASLTNSTKQPPSSYFYLYPDKKLFSSPADQNIKLLWRLPIMFWNSWKPKIPLPEIMKKFILILRRNTPGTRVGPGSRNRKLASGDSPKWVKSKRRKRKKRERLNHGNNNGQLRIATPPRVAHASRLSQHSDWA